jgi:CheY-like chemotaxis protein
MTPNILAIDDDPNILQVYKEILEDQGFSVTGVTSRDAAIAALEASSGWDVILLDEKLLGSGGPATAASVLLDIAALAPAARTIVITGYATVDRVRDAVRAGAWDYLEKQSSFLKVLLPLRVRHAVDAARERRLSRDGKASIEGELRRTWAEVQTGGQPSQVRGRLLEDTLMFLFRTIPGLDEPRLHIRGPAEEFDLVVHNLSSHALLAKERALILVECKNWSGKVDPREADYLWKKVHDRRARASLGILVAPGGFTAGVEMKQARGTNEDEMIVTVDGAQLDAWIGAADRQKWLADLIAASALRI